MYFTVIIFKFVVELTHNQYKLERLLGMNLLKVQGEFHQILFTVYAFSNATQAVFLFLIFLSWDNMLSMKKKCLLKISSTLIGCKVRTSISENVRKMPLFMDSY